LQHANDPERQERFSFMASPALLTIDEIYDKADEPLLLSLGEDRRIERKPPGMQAKALSEYFSVWANTAPDGGLILFGASDDGTPLGLSRLPQERLNDIERAGNVYCPDARYETKRIGATNPKGEPDFLLLIRVHYNAKKVVETVDGSAYIRIGDTKKKLSREEIRELQIDKGQVDLELEPSTIPYPQGFDMEAIAEFAAAMSKAAGVMDRSNESMLEYRRLGQRNSKGRFVPNTACALLFAKDPVAEFPGCKIRFLRFDGEWEKTGADFNAVKDLLIEGNVPSLIVNAEQMLVSQLREFSRLGPDSKFYSTDEYPKDAWYEAIVNACVHRSYGLRNMNIFIKMFDDRLVIESPGGFPPFVTPENIYESHHPRNPHMMNALQYLSFVKCANEGTRRMRDTMQRSNLPHPEFVQKDVGHSLVRVTLRNDIKQRREWVDSNASHIIGEAKARDLGPDEHRAVNFVAEHGRINVSEFMRLTRRSWKSSKKCLMRLAKAEIFTHVHKRGKDRDPEAHFTLKQPPKANGQTAADRKAK